MTAKRVTSDEFKAAFKALSDRASREPIVITEGGRDSLILVGIEEWSRLQLRDRRVGRTEDLPDEWIEAMRRAEVPAEFAHLDDELKRS